MAKPLFQFLIVVAILLLPRTEASADELVTAYETETDYDVVASDLDDAIVNRGYVINNRGNIAEMLERTAGAVGATKVIYRHAEVFEFCSAVFSRSMMEADIRNIAFCPLAVFVYEAQADPGKVVVGFRRLPPGPGRDDVNSLLDSIASEAAGL